jgi:hypothetical protein
MLGEKFSVSTRKVFDTFEHGPFRMWELLVAGEHSHWSDFLDTCRCLLVRSDLLIQ